MGVDLLCFGAVWQLLAQETEAEKKLAPTRTQSSKTYPKIKHDLLEEMQAQAFGMAFTVY